MPIHTCVAECARNGGYICHWGHPFFKDVPSVEFIYLVFTCTPGGVTVGDSGLYCCVPCLSSAIISLCLLILSSMLSVMILSRDMLKRVGESGYLCWTLSVVQNQSSMLSLKRMARVVLLQM